MILILMLWFVLTGNTEMSLFLRKVHSNKGKSKHLDKRRSLFYHSPIAAASHTLKRKSWHLKRNRHQSKLSRLNDEIHMPYKTFENGNKYKRLKPKHVKKHEYGVLYPEETVARTFRKPRVKTLLYQKHNNSTKRNDVMLSIRNPEAKNIKPNSGKFKSKVGPRYTFSFNQMKFKGDFNEDAMHLRNERNQFISPLSSGRRRKFKSNNFMTRNEKLQMLLNKYNLPVYHYPRELQTSTISQVIKKPKYLTLPPFLQLKLKSFQNVSTSTIESSFLTSKLPHESTVSPEYKLPLTDARISNSFPPSTFGLSVPIQNNTPKQDLSQTPAGKQEINEAENLTLPSPFKFTEADSSQEVSTSVGEVSFLTSEIPPESIVLPEYNQLPINVSISNSSLANHFGLPAPVQNNMSEQRNLFQNESNIAKPFLGVFTEVNQQIPTYEQQSAILQGQNINESIVENKTSDTSNVTMYNQSDQNLNLSSKPPFNTSSVDMISDEMSLLQYLLHKLKQIKNIYGRLGSNTKILISSMASILVTSILILLLRSIYRNYKDKKKKRYPFEKKNDFSLLRATRKEQKNLLKTIGYLKRDELTDEDFEKQN